MRIRFGFFMIALLGPMCMPSSASASASQAIDGKALFIKNCAACHGESGVPTPVGRALKPFPARNLRAIAAYVGRKELRGIITNGIQGTSMNPKKYALDRQQIEAVIDYIQTFRYTPDPVNGKQRFQAVCSSCHGMDGRAKNSVGAANLVYSKLDLKGIVHTMRYGRHNTMMTSKRHQLDNTDIADIASYVYSLRSRADARHGQKLYSSYCAACHATPASIKLIGNAAEKATLADLTDEQLDLRIRHGRHVDEAGQRITELGDNDIQDLIAYIRHGAD